MTTTTTTAAADAVAPPASPAPVRARRRRRAHPERWLAFLGLLLISVGFLLPFVWMLSTSLKTLDRAMELPPRLVPDPIMVENYAAVLGRGELNFPLLTRNTLVISLLSVVGTTLSSALVAYGFAKVRFKGRGVLFAVMAVRFGPVAELPAYLYLAAIAVALALIDIDTKRLPNAIVLPSYAVAGTLLTVAAAASGEWDQLLRAGLGGAVMYAFYFVLAVAKPGAMGFGDVKLAGVLGLYLGWLGWSVLVVGLFLGFLFGGALGALLMVVGRASRKSKIPYGPFMLLGAFVAVLFGSALAGWYADSLGLSAALGAGTGVRA